MLGTEESSPDIPVIRYHFSKVDQQQKAIVEYGSRTSNRIRLADAKYQDGDLRTIGIVLGDQDELSRRAGRIKQRGDCLGLRQTLRTAPAEIELRMREEDQVDIYYNPPLMPQNGDPIGTATIGSKDVPTQFTHDTLPYRLEMLHDSLGNMVVRRIDPKDNKAWEFVVPQKATQDVSEIPVNFCLPSIVDQK